MRRGKQGDRRNDRTSRGKRKENFTRQVKAKKHLGQHFLVDEDLARKIASTLSFTGYDRVVEVGPGMGILTEKLLEKSASLTAIELDRESVSYLQDRFAHEILKTKRLEVIQADFLKFNLLAQIADEPFAITGNFPYNISTQIVFKLLEYKDRVPEFTGMFQKEVAERICHAEGSKAYGILSVLVQAFYEAEYLFSVPPESFDPPPKVWSGVLRLRRKKDFTLTVDEKLFFRVVKTAFNQRRKTLRNSLKSFDLSQNLKEDTIFDRRPEQLSVAQFIALTEKIEDDTL